MIWSNSKKLKAVLISSTTKKRFKSIFLFLIGYKEIRANVLFIWKSFTHFFLYKTVAKFYLDILILIREKDIENIFEKFKTMFTMYFFKKWSIYLYFSSKETFCFIDKRYTLLVLEEKSSTVNLKKNLIGLVL